MAGRQTGEKLRALRTDNGLEYVSNNFQNALVKRKVTAWKNKCFFIDEYYNGTIMKSLYLHSLKLTSNMWAESVMTVNHLKIEVVHWTTSEASYFQWFSKKPNVGCFKRIGCTV